MTNLSPKIINSIITQNKFNIKKNLGQNFLWDENVLTKIVDFSGISDETTVLEIGPGLGALTDHLLKKAKKVIAVEIDKSLCEILSKKYENNDKFILIQGDFLKLTENIDDIDESHTMRPLQNIINNGEKLTCVANLPYYITSPIIMRLLTLPFVDSLTVMVQKEVGDRIFAKPSTKDYGILTLAIQYYSTPIDKFFVSRNCFYPAPNVDSMVLKLNKNNNNNRYYNHIANNSHDDFIFKVIRESFSQRRKKLINSLSSSGEIKKEAIKASLEKMGFDENVRAENLTLDNYITLSSLIDQM
ncbi:MAG: 16S rRNA (adenine(1518)-N(6)/adenine(1519)-N(6))-dimethyltransferase RsmA [Lachnospiraceae bacterium]|nr:16S rRNA (adenine(1518)-N(6)/adenine(1519)-N(6))-dimethyltransferase RsmA [Lachnospiraceae bacterium]